MKFKILIITLSALFSIFFIPYAFKESLKVETNDSIFPSSFYIQV